MINTSTKNLSPNCWRAIVWDIDEETGAKLCVAIAESETKFDALRAVLANYHGKSKTREK